MHPKRAISLKPSIRRQFLKATHHTLVNWPLSREDTQANLTDGMCECLDNGQRADCVCLNTEQHRCWTTSFLTNTTFTRNSNTDRK